MSDKGWFKTHRKLFDHWLWDNNKPKTKFEAWLDLIRMANHKDKDVRFRDEIIKAKRGQKITSELKLGKRWKWSRGKVKTFLNRLKNESMLELKQDNRKTIITILNYDTYQSKEKINNTTDSTTTSTATRQQPDINKNERIKELKKKDIPSKKYPEEIIKFSKNYQVKQIEKHGNKAKEITNSFMDSCCDTVDKAIRLDKFNLEEIGDALEWGSRQKFYSDKLYTLTTLRKKWDDGRTKLQHLMSDYEKSGCKDRPKLKDSFLPGVLEKLQKEQKGIQNANV